VKEFGRIENAADYVIGQDPCCTHYGEQRKLSGEIRNVALSWLPPSRTCTIVNDQGSICWLKVPEKLCLKSVRLVFCLTIQPVMRVTIDVAFISS